MRPRARVVAALVTLILLGIVAGAVGARRNRTPSFDPRRSTLLTGPNGAKAFTQSLSRLGVKIERHRRRLHQLSEIRTGEERPILAVLDPDQPLDGTQAAPLVAFFDDQGDLLLAGFGAGQAMQCFGYDVDVRSGDSVNVYRFRNGSADAQPLSWIRGRVLARIQDSVVADTSDMIAGVRRECVVREPSRVDTLLVTAGGRPAALRLGFDSTPGTVTLVADGMLFSNARLKDSDAGLATLPMISCCYQRAIFDEYDHGFGPSGSLLTATLAWSFNSPWGWALWQLAVVGLIALLAGAIRFGPARSVIERRRRSPLEHVHALATALSAAKGSHVAVDLMIRGLRRRLSAGGPPARGDVGPWLASLGENVRSTRAREAVSRLVTLTRRAPGSDSVLRAADAVEEVWQDLKPPSPIR